MATSAVVGKAGVVNIGAALAEVTTWSMDRNTEAVDATSMSSGGNREFLPGLFNWAGVFTTLLFANKTGGPNAATFQVGATADVSNPKFTGQIIITNEPVEVAVDGVVQYAYTFQGTGSVTAATS